MPDSAGVVGSDREVGEGGEEIGEPARLAFALCHEIGNLLAAVRLQAHMLDEGLGRKQIAIASIEIDDLAYRSAALLRHLRPLLAPLAGTPVREDPAAVAAGLEREIAEQGGRGVRIEVQVVAGLARVAIEREVIHHLIASLLHVACEAAQPRGRVVLRVEPREGEVAFVVEDDGASADDPSGWSRQALRGRALLCAVADHILRKRGGRLVAGRSEGLSRVELLLPIA